MLNQKLHFVITLGQRIQQNFSLWVNRRKMEFNVMVSGHYVVVKLKGDWKLITNIDGYFS